MSFVTQPDQPKYYTIILKERLEPNWSEWFDGFTVEQGYKSTILTGRVVDQAALHGLLIKIRDLGLTLVAVEELTE